MKVLYLTIVILFVSGVVHAQKTTDEYFLFSGHVARGENEKALVSAEKVLAVVDQLPEKRQTLFYSRLAKLYETMNNDAEAIRYYEKVASAVPDYYVAHLALGYLYMRPANALVAKLNAARENKSAYDKLYSEYKGYVKKAVPHLEKALACDPNEQVMSLLQRLSKTLSLPADEASINKRVSALQNNCVTLLTE